MNEKERTAAVELVKSWNADVHIEYAIASSPGPATLSRRALALLVLRDAMIKSAAIAVSLEAMFIECREAVGEALVTSGKGGGVQVPEYKAAVLAGLSLDITLKIDDLCPPEALAPGATGYDLTIAQAEASAEQRLVHRLDSLGLAHMARRQVDFEALAGWIEGHEQGAAVAIKDLQGTVEVKSVTVAEVMA